MNKKIMSFVLAMVLSVGLGVSSIFADPDAVSNQTNSGLMRSSGTATSSLNANASSLAGHISTVFHYESGILVSATGADGTVTIYDQGKYRGTMSMGLDGTYSWSNLAFYASDYDVIMKEYGNMHDFLIAIGVKESQLQGGGEEEYDLSLVDPSDELLQRLRDEGYEISSAPASGKYYKYTHMVDNEEVTEIIDEEAYSKLGSDAQKQCTEVEEGHVWTAHKPKTESKPLAWLGDALDHLSKGQNYSISIDFGASQGASVTFNIDGKARQTFAWDGALTTQYEYNPSGMTTYTLEKGVDLKESLEKGKAETEDKWVAQVVVGGKVLGVYDAEQTATGFVVTGSVSSKEYSYNADGSIQSVFDATTSQTTHYLANKVTSITGPLKDANGNTVYENYEDENGNSITKEQYDKLSDEDKKKYSNTRNKSNTNVPVMATVAFYTYYDNGLINTVESNGTDGSITTTAYINNKAVVTYNGTAADADVIRANVLEIFSIVDQGLDPETIVLDSRIQSIQWQPEQLAKIYNNGNWDMNRLKAFVKACGWDWNEEGQGNESAKKAKELIEQSINNSNWVSQALTISYASTAYGQSEIDSLEGGEETTRLPANKYAYSVTTYNRGVAYAQYSFAKFDPSISRAYYLFFQETFDTNSDEFKKMMSDLGIDPNSINDTMGWEAYEDLIDKITDYLCDLIDSSLTYKDKDGKVITADEYAKLSDEEKEKCTVILDGLTETKDGDTTTFTHPTIQWISKIFKNGKFGEFYATLTQTYQSTTVDGGTNATHSHHARNTSVSTSTGVTNNYNEQKNALVAEFAKQMLALKSKIKSFFLNAKGNITSGNLESLKSALGSEIEGWTGSWTATQTTTYTTHTDIDLDPAVVGTVTGFTYFSSYYEDENGNRITEEEYNALSAEDKKKYSKTELSEEEYEALSDDEKALFKKYAILSNVSVDITGEGFQSGGTETMYVELTDEQYNDLKAAIAASEDGTVAFAAAGFIGEDLNGNCVLVNTYASDISTDMDALAESFAKELEGNSQFQQAMRDNKAKIDDFVEQFMDQWENISSWAASQGWSGDSISVDWYAGWKILQGDFSNVVYNPETNMIEIAKNF
ncbi:MAG: hypothetical protein IKN42_03100 [Elusimicrobia bacterium]|nr:hypothetical protein [Elusimicrobiota bacterium]